MGIKVAINSKLYDVPASLDPTTTLNDFLRRFTPFKGTKLACGEGGCGACAVEVAKYDISSGTTKVSSINSCLAPIASMDGAAITTVEGIGNSKSGYHEIQERVAGFHASQCGFCTPGMVVATHAALVKFAAQGIRPTPQQLEKTLDGNLCRCTGYRPLLSVAKSFGDDLDIEDLGITTLDKDKLGPVPMIVPEFPEPLKEHLKAKSGAPAAQGDRLWGSPRTLKELLGQLETAKASGEPAWLVAGNTAVGVFKNWPTQKNLIDITQVAEFRKITSTKDGVSVGAAVPVADLIEYLRSSGVAAFTQMADHLDRLAGQHVRSAATVCGNIVLARTKGLQSDAATVLATANASVTISSPTDTKVVPLVEFVAGGAPLGDTEVVSSITIPTPPEGALFWSHRIAVRWSNAVSSINAGVYLELDVGKAVSAARVIFGYPGEEKWILGSAAGAAAALKGSPVSGASILAAIQALPGDLTPGSSSPTLKFAEGLLLQALSPLADGPASAELTALLSAAKFPAPEEVHTHQDTTVPIEKYAPVGQPVARDRVKLQASGEAIYTSDVVMPVGGLYGAFVQTSVANADIVSVDPAPALALPGVEAFIGPKDIPEGGSNQIAMMGEAIFATTRAEYIGERVGLILAETQVLAEAAAKAVVVEYANQKPAITTIAEAIAAGSLYDHVKEFPQLAPAFDMKLGGDVEAALSSSKNVLRDLTYSTPSQVHFYMEPQAAVAIPDENDTMLIHSGTQGVDFIQGAVCQALGKPFNKIQAVGRRLGGGFGGKSTRSVPTAVAAAVAAAAVGRPVRVVLGRNTDFQLIGGRLEFDTTSTVAFDDTGKIEALDVKAFCEAGAYADASGSYVPFLFNTSIDQVYSIPALTVSIRVARTNVVPRTIMRGPGTFQAVLVIESVIQAIAGHLGIDPVAVREANLLTGPKGHGWRKPCAGELAVGAEVSDAPYHVFSDEISPEIVTTTLGKEIPLDQWTVPRLWTDLKAAADYDTRYAAVQAFNAEHKWRKRGISITPGRFGMSVDPKPAAISIYHDGTVLIASPGHEMGQGINTKVLQTAVYELSKVLPESQRPFPLELIHLADNSSNLLPNTGPSWGSTTSEAACEAVRLVCKSICDQLAPHLAELGEDATWKKLLATLHPTPGFSASKTLLSAYAYYDGTQRAGDKGKALDYNGYGVACSEVEVDIATGEKRVVRADIMLDAAHSLNPASDIGQIEGGFVQGLGSMLAEEVKKEAGTGRLISDGTWTYKVPSASCIPRQLNVHFLKDSPNPRGILSSKAVGEPPLLLSVSALSALSSAVSAAKKDLGDGAKGQAPVVLEAPATAERIVAALGGLSIPNVLQHALAA